jgi:glycosyltransferase involved in cell wall biosynthesis
MKKKILLLSDDLRMSSGISNMSKEIVLGTVDKFDWVQLGAAIKHPELGKIVDISEDVRNKTGVLDANVKIVPYNGYGDINIIRKLIKDESPDAILHFTDPHYWQWLYDNEHEIRQHVPILYYHVWDNLPDPIYNRNYYESCDWIGCISKQTYGIVNRVGMLNDKSTYTPLNKNQVSYVPHGVNENIYKPLDSVSDDITKMIHGDKKYDFILFYNNRNIRRKQASDVIYSFRLFCDMLSKKESSKCLLLMHTSSVDQNGTDLNAVVEVMCKEYDVKITDRKFEQSQLNELYNSVDCTINIAGNEGFGLTTIESLMTGTPIIVNVTGGLQDHCGFEYNEDDYISIKSLHIKNESYQTKHGEWVKPVWSSVNTLNGSPATPYIFDDKVNNDEVSKAIYFMYRLGNKERKRIGALGREFAKENFSSKNMCDKMIIGIEDTIENWKPKKRYNLYKII